MTQTPRAEGQEVLVVDGDPKVRQGLETLLQKAGLVPTAVADPDRAVALVREKYFAVALIDLDTPHQSEGLGLLAQINAYSPATVVMVMAARRTFEAAVSAFRAGAADVIFKAPDQVPYLEQQVVAAALDQRRAADTRRLVEDASRLHEEMMQILVTNYCKAAEMQERTTGTYDVTLDGEVRVLVVDQDSWLQSQLGRMVQAKGGYGLVGASTGGEALDMVGRERFHIALVGDQLVDLPGSMVVRAIKAQTPETIVLLYTHPTQQRPGSVQVSEGSKVIPFIPEFTDPQQLLERLDELRDAFIATSRERRYLAAFRMQYPELLRRYAELRQRLQRSKE